jgi:hypothetical protein
LFQTDAAWDISNQAKKEEGRSLRAQSPAHFVPKENQLLLRNDSCKAN